MPYDHQKKILFIHIPKNAGTSISKSFNMDFFHYPYTYYETILTKEQLETYYKFTIVRNPWDRIVSCYSYATMLYSHFHSPNKTTLYDIHPDYKLLKNKTFLECVKLLKTDPQKFKHECWFPQSYWITDSSKNIIVDKIFKFENINELSEKFNNLQIPKINSSNRNEDFKSYYTEESMNLIHDIYKQDIITFNYKF
jgi:hypothetical protein